ncbi:hypothetical protein [uncultured Ramlibacter sp.]|uniref:hypothetical protein n=1 Tax=uncultured Ramlibacter sp. TaxID=260755 RepID=UPI0026103527|nr:hypothetical protein [uncultured Ramlibacter sp.]
MKTIWMQTLLWLAAVATALALAFATPSESSVMGRLPSLTAKRLDSQMVSLPQGLPASRTLALVAFQGGHHGEIDSWIRGLQLRQDASIPWMKIPVLEDPGNEGARSVIENRMLARHTSQADRERLLPIFTDRNAFVRSAGLSGTDHAGVLVLGRDGRVLARVEGHFDQDKAQALLETLVGRDYD